MRIKKRFLQSKVGRRILTLFILCALVPITAVAIVSYTRVSNELDKQNERQLHQSSRVLGKSIFERVAVLEDQFKALCSNSLVSSSNVTQRPDEGYGEETRTRFKGLAIITDSGEVIPCFGHTNRLADLSAEETEHLKSGKTLMITHTDKDTDSRIYMLRFINPKDQKQGMLYGEIDPMYLWFLNENPWDILPYKSELVVLDDSSRVIYSTMPVPSSLRERPEYKMLRTRRAVFRWDHEGEKEMASFQSLSIRDNVGHPEWTLVLTVPEKDMGKPVAQFKKTFPLVVLLSFWVVLLLSFIQIRRTTLPLEELGKGTRRIAMRDFDSRVMIESGDEFEELATDFNDMAKQLGRQFNALTTMAEIDRAILSDLDTEKIVRTVITRMYKFFDYDFVSVTLLDPEGKNSARTFMENRNPSLERSVKDFEIPRDEFEGFIGSQSMLLIDKPEDLPPCFSPFAAQGLKSFVFIPIFLKEGLVGIIMLASLDSFLPDQEDLNHAHQLADQVAVALSNAQLIEDLNAFNWGALKAFARAVDAKSPWTHGHSERVTERALKIGQVMGLAPAELDDLHRAGLLHDIGKIGIDRTILDKPGKVNDDEVKEIQKHPSKGALILEPISAYSRVVRIVKQHHEHFDGTGYPDGLAGEEIDLCARILAVADVYDALVSDRPYRSGMEPERVIEIIKEKANKQFDPTVVKAFLKVMMGERSTE